MAGARGGLITAVQPGSLGDELGLAPGDRVLAVNGRPLSDLIDYLSETDDEKVLIEVKRQDGERIEFELEKDLGESLGLEFASAVFDGTRRCRNRCVFCFVDQLPAGLRPSLYVKDDDYRLSFCQGNFITLTNLSEEDIARITQLRLSPLYVSLHALDPAVRRALLRNPLAGEESLAILRKLLAAGIAIHAQLVLCPGWNDGEVLERTLAEVERLGEGVLSVAAVPVAVSRHRSDHVPLRAFARQGAREVLAAVHRWQERFYRRRGTRLVFAADEFYLRAGEPIPPSAAYEDFAQLEDGIGLLRRFWDDAQEALERAGRSQPSPGRECHVVTGLAGAHAVQPVLLGLARRGLSVGARLLVVRNTLFDPEETTVTGLLAGQDVAAAVRAARMRGETVQRVLVPDVLFRSGGGVTLDDLTAEDLADLCAAAVEVVPADGAALVNRLAG